MTERFDTGLCDVGADTERPHGDAAENARRFLEFERSPAPSLPASGDRIGEFVVEREIGRGAHGVVLLARQESLARRVALKLVPFGIAALDPAYAERFQREGRILATLRHPAIVAVHAAGIHASFHFVAMDFVDGTTLRELLTGRVTGLPAPEDERWLAFALHGLSRIAGALGEAHARGVVHRDVKPANLLIDRTGDMFLADFGLARADQQSNASTTDGFVGTPRYASPEQCRGERASAASDVFALGAVLFEVVSGRSAFDGRTTADVSARVQFAELAWTKAKHIPGDLRAVIEKCLEKRAVDRYADARELEADLERFLRFEPVLARTRGPFSRAWRRLLLRPARAATAAALVVCAAAAFVAVLVAGRQRLDLERMQSRAEYDAAERLFHAGSFDAAASALDRLALAPETSALRGELSRWSRGESGWTKGELDAALRVRPASYPLRVARARSLARAGDRQEAVRDYRLALDVKPGDRTVVRELARVLFDLRRFAEQEDLLRTALAARPEDGPLLADLAFCIGRTPSRRPEALDVAQCASLDANEDPHIAAVRGCALLWNHRTSDAHASLAAALDRWPGDGEIALMLGYVELEERELVESEANARRAVARAGGERDLAALELLGKVQWERREYAEAADTFAQLEAIDPGNARWPAQAGRIQLLLDHVALARACCDRALARDSTDTDVLILDAHLLRRAGDLPSALRSYERAMALHPDDVQMQYWVAEAWFELDEPRAALRYLPRVLARAPTWFPGLVLEAHAETVVGDFDRALDAYAKALALQNEPELRADYAEALDRAGFQQKAIDEYQRARADEPELAAAWFGEALVRLDSVDPELRDPCRAVELIERALELAPREPEYAQQLVRARAAAETTARAEH